MLILKYFWMFRDLSVLSSNFEVRLRNFGIQGSAWVSKCESHLKVLVVQNSFPLRILLEFIATCFNQMSALLLE